VDALRGVFRDDPLTQAAVARHKVDTARWAEALALLDQINVKADRMLALEVALLRARALLGCQRWPEAEGVLRSLQGQLIGEEPRYFLALALQGLGRPNEAIDLWRDILKRYRKGGPAWRRSEKRWFRLAQQRLEETKAS
jgi:hypothetical protein